MTTRKARVTKHDVISTFLLNGIDQVADILEGHSNPVKCLDDAMQQMQKTNSSFDVSPLATLRDSLKGGNGGGRGARGLKELGSKSYSAQQVKDGVPFIRLPLDALGVVKGESVLVSVQEDGSLRVVRS